MQDRTDLPSRGSRPPSSTSADATRTFAWPNPSNKQHCKYETVEFVPPPSSPTVAYLSPLPARSPSPLAPMRPIRVIKLFASIIATVCSSVALQRTLLAASAVAITPHRPSHPAFVGVIEPSSIDAPLSGTTDFATRYLLALTHPAEPPSPAALRLSSYRTTRDVISFPAAPPPTTQERVRVWLRRRRAPRRSTRGARAARPRTARIITIVRGGISGESSTRPLHMCWAWVPERGPPHAMAAASACATRT